MKFDTDVKVSIDLQEVFEKMGDIDQRCFMQENISYATDDALIQELVNRGFEITKG